MLYGAHVSVAIGIARSLGIEILVGALLLQTVVPGSPNTVDRLMGGMSLKSTCELTSHIRTR